ncbi:hypothetical protein D3C72_2591850 [compost metagenome]
MTAITIREQLLLTEHGCIHAKQWRLTMGGGLEAIVLLHDLLGCVALWHDYP